MEGCHVIIFISQNPNPNFLLSFHPPWQPPPPTSPATIFFSRPTAAFTHHLCQPPLAPPRSCSSAATVPPPSSSIKARVRFLSDQRASATPPAQLHLQQQPEQQRGTDRNRDSAIIFSVRALVANTTARTHSTPHFMCRTTAPPSSTVGHHKRCWSETTIIHCDAAANQFRIHHFRSHRSSVTRRKRAAPSDHHEPPRRHEGGRRV